MKQTGKVKFFDSKKGFGFITPSDGSEEVFVHQTAIHSDGFRSLAEGEPVEYDVQSDERKQGKKFASNVTGPNGSEMKFRLHRQFYRYLSSDTKPPTTTRGM